MLHGTDETTVRQALQRAGYQTTNIPTPTQVSQSIPLHSLMPYQCNFLKLIVLRSHRHMVLSAFKVKRILNITSHKDAIIIPYLNMTNIARARTREHSDRKSVV